MSTLISPPRKLVFSLISPFRSISLISLLLEASLHAPQYTKVCDEHCPSSRYMRLSQTACEHDAASRKRTTSIVEGVYEPGNRRHRIAHRVRPNAGVYVFSVFAERDFDGAKVADAPGSYGFPEDEAGSRRVVGGIVREEEAIIYET